MVAAPAATAAASAASRSLLTASGVATDCGPNKRRVVINYRNALFRAADDGVCFLHLKCVLNTTGENRRLAWPLYLSAGALWSGPTPSARSSYPCFYKSAHLALRKVPTDLRRVHDHIHF